MTPLFRKIRSDFHRHLLESVLTRDANGVISFADKNNRSSVAIAENLTRRLGDAKDAIKAAGQTAGNSFENHCARFLTASFQELSHLRPGKWEVVRISGRRKNAIARFEQYEHLTDLEEAIQANRELASALGNDYAIAPDIVITREPETDSEINRHRDLVDETVARHAPLRRLVNELPLIHASVSCKWTLRSDRAQNARSEALNLIRNRKGRCPHIAVVTAEPTPSRLSSLALGTGDLDCVYHFALEELIQSIEETCEDDTRELLGIMVAGKRLKDISDLPLDLAV